MCNILIVSDYAMTRPRRYHMLGIFGILSTSQ